MTTTAAEFTGSIPQTYDRYLVPLIFDTYARDLVGRAAVQAGGRVLETACGTGVVTRHLLAALPERATLVASDLNVGMLDRAREAVGSSDRVLFQLADGTALPFDDESFDAVVCQFGVMFFPDKALGYREAARVLRPGGSFAFNVWDSLERNRFCGFVHETLARLFPESPPDFLSVPFGYHDVSEIEDELRRAGFGAVETTVLPGESRAPSPRDVATALIAGTPLAAQCEGLADRGAIIEEVTAAVRAEFGAGSVRGPMQAIAIVATRGPA